jgi:hypothetical protein
MNLPQRSQYRRWTALLVGPALLLFTGCMVGPDFHRPNVAVSETWLETRDRRAYQNAVLSAQRDVEDNLVAFLRAQDRAELLAQSVTSAQTALDLAVLQYREGLTDFTTVLTVQQTLLTQQDSLASTLGDISTSLVGIYRALGGGWEIRESRELVPPEIKAEMQRRTNWGRLLIPANYNLPASRQSHSAPRLPDW